MKAAVCKRYGPPEVLQIEEVEKPVPKDREVLIRVHATAVNSSDWYMRSAMRRGRLWMRALVRLFVGFRARQARWGRRRFTSPDIWVRK